jgi:hypothetical protein
MTNEKQKPVKDSYRNNWDDIFQKKEEKEESPFEIEIEADNSEQKAQVTLKVEF